jgi:hypothetical protein
VKPELAAAEELARSFTSELGGSELFYRGPASIRFTVRSEGTVATAELIMDRVKRLGGHGQPAAELLTRLVDKVTQLRFEHAAEDTHVILPFAF